jgi:nicotinamide phosphoribosyltransferase
MLSNLVLMSDSYKYSHWDLIPSYLNEGYSYIESRGGMYPETVFFGLQYYLKEYLSKPITKENIDEARDFMELHGEPFYYSAWKYIVDKHGGYLPIKIKAVPEGIRVPCHNILMSIQSTDPNLNLDTLMGWTSSWVEPLTVKVWAPITVATRAWTVKQVIKRHHEKTCDNLDGVSWGLQDFSLRGVSSTETASLLGAAHLTSFMGSDNVPGVWTANKYYNCKMSGFSIPALEHFATTSWGKENEVDCYRNAIKKYCKPGKMVAIVLDTYDYYYALEHLIGGVLKDDIIKSGGKVICRPDSGIPSEVDLKSLQILESKFSFKTNSKGFKELNSVGVIQGDAVEDNTVEEVYTVNEKHGFAANNMVFGSGGWLAQKLDRDTNKFAQKASQVSINGVKRDINKSPVTAPWKSSKKGRLDLVFRNNKLQTVSGENNSDSIMSDVFENGKILKEYTLDEVRANTEKTYG